MNEAISKDPLYSEIMKNRCLTCYKDEKRLVPLTKKRLLKMFVPEITLTHNDRVCESCDSMLKAMMKFRNTVLNAQLLLKTVYEQQSQDIEQKISMTKIPKEDVGHCSTLFSEHFSHPIKQEMKIKEESIDIELALDNSEDPLPVDPIPEEVQMKRESTDTDSSVDSEETSEGDHDPTSEGDHNSEKTFIEISVGGMFNRETMKVNKVTSDSTKVNSKNKNKSPLLKRKLVNVPGMENKIKVNEENTVNVQIKTIEEPPKDGTTVMFGHEQAFTVKVLSEADMQADREDKRMQPHYIKSKFKCEMCITIYTLQKDYEEHMKTHDLNAGRFPCTVCQQRFTNNANMDNHRKTHYIKYMCTKCSTYGSTSLEQAQVHYDRQHYVEKRFCKKCGAEFNLYRELHTHLLMAHGTKSKCPDCGVAVRNKYQMQIHKARHTDITIVECNVCNKKIEEHKLKLHMKYVHDPDGAAYCIPCDQTFKSYSLYQIHIKQSQKHNSVENFKVQCEVCGRWLGSRKSLKVHMDTVHSDTAKYPCDKCDQKFKSLKTLRTHTRKKHENDTRIRDKICEQCGKGFLHNKTLEEHMNTHTGARPHSCADCGVSFGFKSALFTHRRLKHKVKRKKDI